jgi:hypothetical protein
VRREAPRGRKRDRLPLTQLRLGPRERRDPSLRNPLPQGERESDPALPRLRHPRPAPRSLGWCSRHPLRIRLVGARCRRREHRPDRRLRPHGLRGQHRLRPARAGADRERSPSGAAAQSHPVAQLRAGRSAEAGGRPARDGAEGDRPRAWAQRGPAPGGRALAGLARDWRPAGHPGAGFGGRVGRPRPARPHERGPDRRGADRDTRAKRFLRPRRWLASVWSR